MDKTDINAANKSFHTSKVLNAAIDKVWEVWTKPEHIAQWWGPNGFTNTIHIMDLKPDGEWCLTMHGPDGKRYPNKSEFIEIIPHEKIVFRHFNPNYLATIIFEPKGDDTLLDWTMQFDTVELFETVVKVFKADEGLRQNVEKLENYLKEKI